MIRFSQVVKIYNARSVLNDVSFTVEKGEFVSVVGRSGAGKTTIAKLILGVEKPDLGFVSMDGLLIADMRPRTLQILRRRIGIVFQDYRLLPDKTVFDNVAFALEVVGDMKEGDIQVQVTKVLNQLGLFPLRDSFPSTLSGGEQQRVAIARALVHQPELLIADEPTGNLDPESTRVILSLLKAIHDSGTTVILTTHDPEVVNFFEERVLYIEDGHIKSDKKNARYPENNN
ncbi:ATP-binding cassette domain-containing protein [Candidatus Gracilibacteria bacterium]|nr:ATP-binding cassette domain-containing protein [Candidatus Gracilibacteria bacterium]